VTTSGCLSIVTEDDNPCPVSYAITIAPDGGSIDTFSSAGGDDLDASFEVQIYLTVAGPGVSDAGRGDQEVDLEDALPINAQFRAV